MDTKTLIVGEDMICPVTKKHCDDECCTVGSECNVSGDELVNSEYKDLFEGKKIDYTDSKSLAEDCWLFLTDDSMPNEKLITKEAFLHEVGAMLESTIQFNQKNSL